MTVMIGMSAPAPQPVDPAPSADPVSSERPAPFGPALSRARNEVARSDDESARQRVDVDDTSPAENEHLSLSENEADGEPKSEPDVSEPSTSAPGLADGRVATDPAILDHPTAKGNVGAGGPSTDLTVEAAATPSTVGVLTVDGRRPHSVDPLLGADTARSTADPIVPAGSASPLLTEAQPDNASRSTTDLRTNLTIGAETGDTDATPAAMAPGTSASPGQPQAVPQVQQTGSSVEEGGNGSLEGELVSVAHDTQLEPVGTEVVEPAGKVAVEVPQGQPLAAASPLRPDAIVVNSNEAVRGVESHRPVGTASATPTPGPLESAQGSLWEDVRLAFDRMRSSGDVQEVRIRLRPAELGELMVQIKTQGDHVAVRLVASSSAAQQALIDDRLRLASELARAGFEEGSVDISQQETGSPAHRDRGAGDDRDRGRTITEPHSASDGRPAFERREPIRTESVFRPGRHAYSTINLTL